LSRRDLQDRDRRQDAAVRANGRSRDTAPHYGGAGIRLWDERHFFSIGVCSTAFAVTRGEVAHMLTVAHCFPSRTDYPRAWASSYTSETSPGTACYHGAMVTTTMGGTATAVTDGTQDQYGDFALLQGGGGYSARVSNCAKNADPCSSLAVGRPTTAPNGTPLCTSGVMSGQICRQYVTDGSYAGWLGDGSGSWSVLVDHWAVTNSDQNGDGTYDCVGPVQGDSGGAVYRSMADGTRA
ncbi:hypothetical protein JYK22_23485, partial [Nonomuraea sp. RK-328]|nr:hypothetical protein [Nonomuraea sp. RK-328]